MTDDLRSDYRTKLQGNPEAPMCGFSNMACRILDAYSKFLSSRGGPFLPGSLVVEVG